jgi:type I site-specific restriction endonuclease
MNEADTRAQYIDPKLKQSGWDENEYCSHWQQARGKLLSLFR